MNADLERFYSLIQRLESRPEQGRRLCDCTGRDGWPKRGVYFFRESTEYRGEQRDVARIVRVGTHAVSAGAKSTLWGRLRTHRGTLSGGGNHRGSIFRSHVGAAILAREGVAAGSWGVDRSAAKSVRLEEAPLERRVSEYIGAMSVLWLDVPDDAGADSLRSWIERNAIALVSTIGRQADGPSGEWLGRHSPNAVIRESGLWNLDYVDGKYEARFLDDLERSVEATISAITSYPR